MNRDFHELGRELLRVLREFSPTEVNERSPETMKLVLKKLDDAMRAEQGQPPRPWPWPGGEGGADGGRAS